MAARSLCMACVVALVLIGAPARAEAPDLTGVWEVTGDTQLYGQFRFFVEIRKGRDSAGRETWDAVKRTGTPNVPASETHFRAHMTEDASGGQTRYLLTAEVRVAFPGFLHPVWEEHAFWATPTELTLASDVPGPVITHTDAEGNIQLASDKWKYTKWNGREFRIQPPEVNDYAFTIKTRELQREIADKEHAITSAQARIAEREAELARILHDDPERKREAQLLKEKDAAYDRWQEAKGGTAPPKPPPPANLQRMMDHLASLEARKSQTEDQIIAANAAGDAAMRDQLFRVLASIEQQIADTKAAIRRIASETGYDLSDPVKTVDPAAIAAAEEAYNAAFRAWYLQNRSNEDREPRAAEISTGLERLRADVARLNAEVAALRETAKGYGNGRQLSRVSVLVAEPASNGAFAARRTVFDLAPSDADLDLEELTRNYRTKRDEFREIEQQRAAFLNQFNTIQQQIIEKNDELVGAIITSGYKQAVVEAGAFLASVAISWGTGGAGGALIDAIAQLGFTCAFNKDCVAFENFDESNMQRSFVQKRDELLAEHPLDENETCSFLPGLQAIDGEHRLAEFARVKVPDKVELGFQLFEVSGTASQRLGTGATTVLTAAGSSVKEALTEVGGTKLVVWYQKDIAEELIKQEYLAAVRQAQIESIRLTLGRSSRQVAADAAAYETAKRLIREAEGVIADPAASRAAKALAQETLEKLLPQVRQADLLGKIDVRKGFERWAQLDAKLADEARKLKGLQWRGGQAESAFKGSASVKSAIAKAGVNVLAGIMIGLGKNAWQDHIKQRERDLWAEIFTKQIEASVYFQAYQRVSCLYWTRLDQIAWIQRQFAPIYFSYVQNHDLFILRDDPFTDDESLLVAVEVRGGPARLGSRTEIGGIPCRRVDATNCRIAASEWAKLRDRAPTLPFRITLEPPDY